MRSRGIITAGGRSLRPLATRGSIMERSLSQCGEQAASRALLARLQVSRGWNRQATPADAIRHQVPRILPSPAAERISRCRACGSTAGWLRLRSIRWIVSPAPHSSMPPHWVRLVNLVPHASGRPRHARRASPFGRDRTTGSSREPAIRRKSPRKLIRALALLEKWVRFAKNGEITSLPKSPSRVHRQQPPPKLGSFGRNRVDGPRNWVRSAEICRQPGNWVRSAQFRRVRLGSFVAYSSPVIGHVGALLAAHTCDVGLHNR